MIVHMLYYWWYCTLQWCLRFRCTHKEWLQCDEDPEGTLLMDEKFEITCNRCGTTWNKTAYEIINVPLEEW